MPRPSEPGSAPDGRPRRRFPMWLAILAATASGALLAVQSRINGELGRQLNDGYTAAAISFGSGLVILLIVLCVWKPGRVGLGRVARALRPNELGERELKPWMLLGGLAGAFFVASQGLTAAVLGVALFTVAIVAGQTISGMVLDRVGLAPGGHRPLTADRLIGSLLALAAVVWAVSAQLGGDVPFWMLIMPLIAGALAAWQQAVNGQVRAAAASAQSATLINFIVGSAALITIALVRNAVLGWPAEFPAEPWLYIGGAIGCLLIAVQTVLVKVTGVLLLGLATVSGQLVAALLLDLSVPGQAVAFSTIGGTLVALIAVVVASGWLNSWRRATTA
ncbi:DMT family transporter [Microterricola viridarii]|nr:DMT family transporter [Microterricola viridarii]